MYEFCSSDMQKKLSAGRGEETKQLEEETKRMIENKDKGAPNGKEEEKVPLLASNKEEKKNEDKEQLVADDILNMPFDKGLDTGKYHLVGVVTHKGRYADSGHYVGWTYHKQNTWLKFDDDIVSTVKTKDILDLRGGGDWHMAYICVYRKLQILPKPESPKAKPMTDIKPN
jgi:ubiquitin carboxyl-terminal hydrolase 14